MSKKDNNNMENIEDLDVDQERRSAIAKIAKLGASVPVASTLVGLSSLTANKALAS